MPDANEPAAPRILEDCWTDERDMKFNAEIHNLLDVAANKLDTKGPVKSITRALPVIDDIRSKLIAEAAFRGAPVVSDTKVTPIRTATPRTMTDAENDAMQAISEARSIANLLCVAANNDGDVFMEELGWATLQTNMHIVIEKLDLASNLIAQRSGS